MEVFVKRSRSHDVVGLPDAYAVCARGLVPGVKTSQPIAVVWGRSFADDLIPHVKRVLETPKAKPARKKAVTRPTVEAAPLSPVSSSDAAQTTYAGPMPIPCPPYIASDLSGLVVPIETLAGMEGNARVHDERNLDVIRKSLTGFRQLKPVVLEADGRTVIAGNGTLRAALALGWTHIAAVNSGLSGDRARAYSLADNRSTDLSTFDGNILSETLRDIDRSLADIAGFNDADFAGLFGPAAGMHPHDPVITPDDPAIRPTPQPHQSVEAAPTLTDGNEVTTLVIGGTRDEIEYCRQKLEAYRLEFGVPDFCQALTRLLNSGTNT